MRWSKSSVRRAPDLALLLSLAASSLAAGDLAFVTCQNGDALSVIDVVTEKEVSRWSLPGKPAGVAASPGAVFTVSADSKVVRRLDPSNGHVLAHVTLDGGPIGITVDARRARVFVSDWYNARIWVLEAESLGTETELVTGAAPAGLDISPDGTVLASADRDADQVSLFDAESLTLRHRIDTGTRPFGLRFAPDGRLFVANVGSNDVTVIDPIAGTVTATVAVGERPYGVAFARNRAFITNQYENTVSVIDLATFATLATLESGEYPEGIDPTSDGGHILLGNWLDNTVTKSDAETLSVVETIDTCDGPRAFGAFVLGGTP